MALTGKERAGEGGNLKLKYELELLHTRREL